VDDARRERIVHAAARLFVTRGYAGASTRDIATAAKVSKREIYALFENKQAILHACVARRIAQIDAPVTLPPVSDRASLARALGAFASNVLRELCRPSTIALYRLAVVEAKSAPEIARALDSSGRVPLRRALTEWLAAAQAGGLLGEGDADLLSEQFLSLLLGELRLRLILGVLAHPTEDEMGRRAKRATDAFLRLH
jgi:AcrR family transcriptional regulator